MESLHTTLLGELAATTTRACSAEDHVRQLIGEVASLTATLNHQQAVTKHTLKIQMAENAIEDEALLLKAAQGTTSNDFSGDLGGHVGSIGDRHTKAERRRLADEIQHRMNHNAHEQNTAERANEKKKRQNQARFSQTQPLASSPGKDDPILPIVRALGKPGPEQIPNAPRVSETPSMKISPKLGKKPNIETISVPLPIDLIRSSTSTHKHSVEFPEFRKGMVEYREARVLEAQTSSAILPKARSIRVSADFVPACGMISPDISIKGNPVAKGMHNDAEVSLPNRIDDQVLSLNLALIGEFHA